MDFHNNFDPTLPQGSVFLTFNYWLIVGEAHRECRGVRVGCLLSQTFHIEPGGKESGASKHSETRPRCDRSDTPLQLADSWNTMCFNSQLIHSESCKLSSYRLTQNEFLSRSHTRTCTCKHPKTHSVRISFFARRLIDIESTHTKTQRKTVLSSKPEK